MIDSFATTGDAAMTIGNAVERDQFVYVYDEKGYQLGTLFAGNGPDDGLKGYRWAAARPSQVDATSRIIFYAITRPPLSARGLIRTCPSLPR